MAESPPDSLFHDLDDDLSSMRRYARSLCADASAADDVVQDSLLKALERRDSFRAQGSRKSWLLSIVHNVFVSGLRRRQAESLRDQRFAETLTQQLPAEQEQQARLAEIARSFAGLPELQREVLHLVAIEGMSYQQAAEVLSVPIGTVMSRLSRARAAMRKHNDNDEHDDAQPASLRIVGGRDEE